MGWWIVNTMLQCLCVMAWYVNRANLPSHAIFVVSMILTTLAFETMAAYYGYVLRHTNNLFFFHFLTPIQYALLVYPYSRLYEHKFLKISVIASIYLVFLTAFVFSQYVQPLNVYNTYVQLICFFLIVLWAGLYLFYRTANDSTIILIKDSMILIGISLIFYSSLSFVSTGMLNYLIAHKNKWTRVVYDFTTIVAFSFYVLLTFTFFSQRIVARLSPLNE